jgi:hypothetical protein
MRNPGGKEFSQGNSLCFRKGKRVRRATERPRLKSACFREGPLPWSPKESVSLPGPGLHRKLGVGKLVFIVDFLLGQKVDCL